MSPGHRLCQKWHAVKAMSEKASQVASEEDEMVAHLAQLREARNGPEQMVQETTGPVAELTVDAPAAKAVQPKADKPTEVPAADATAPAADTTPKTPEQALAEKQAELHRVTSELGRVSALNRKNMESAQRIAGLERELQEARKPPQTQAEARSRFEDLAEQVKDFPELLAIVKTVGDALNEVEGKAQSTATKAAQKALEPMEPLRQQYMDKEAERLEASFTTAKTAFDDTYPDAVAVIKSDDFKQWLPLQSRAIQWAFYKGETPSDAMPVMDAYDSHLRRSGQPSIARTQTPQQDAPAASTTPDNRQDERLRRAAGIPSRQGSGSKGALPAADDFEGSLDYWRAKRLARARAAAS